MARAVPYEDSRGQFAGFIASAVDVEERPPRALCNRANEFFEMSTCKDGTANAYIEKPFNPQHVRDIVERAVSPGARLGAV